MDMVCFSALWALEIGLAHLPAAHSPPHNANADEIGEFYVKEGESGIK
jgi:hypothetical protein